MEKRSTFGLQNRILTQGLNDRPSAKSAFQSVLGRSFRASGTENNTLPNAKPIGSFPPNRRTIKDNVGTADPIDLFSANITAPTAISLNFENRSTRRISVALLNSQGAVISSDGQKQTIAILPGQKVSARYGDAIAGTYYVQVRSNAQGANRYTLKLSTPNPGGSPGCGCGS